MVLLLPRKKRKCTEKCMAKALTKQRGWLQGPLLLCPRPCVGLWLHSNAGRGQGVCPHVPGAGSKAVLGISHLSCSFHTALFSLIHTVPSGEWDHTPAGWGEVRTSFCSVPRQDTEGQCTLDTQWLRSLQQIMSGTDKSIGACEECSICTYSCINSIIFLCLTVTSKSWNNSLALFARACLCSPSGGGTSISNWEPNIAIG